MKVVSEKIPELINLSTTGTIAREIKGSIRSNMNGDDPNVIFHNGSWIKVVPSTHNARSSRANILVLDEFRMVKPEIYLGVLRRFLAVQRQPGYLSLDEYKGKQEYTERNQEIFLSSCYYKHNWSYARYRVFFNNMLRNKGYFVCGIPYQIAIKEGLTSKEQLMDEMNEEDFDEALFEMEMKCMFYGESLTSYFKYDEISKCRTLKKPMVPFTDQTFVDSKGDTRKLPFFRPKQKNEIRLLLVDLALVRSKKNDASVYMVVSLIPQSETFSKTLDYIETSEGTNTEVQAFRVKQLFYDLECDYCVMDTQGKMQKLPLTTVI